MQPGIIVQISALEDEDLTWVATESKSCQPTGTPTQPTWGLAGTHWDALLELLPAYRRITRVDIGDGEYSFVDDVWLGTALLWINFLHCTATALNKIPRFEKR
jgi:hypothetical protein